MKRVVCAVFDSAVQAFGQPIFAPAVGAVVRSFSDEVNRSALDNPMFGHPDDYELFYLGLFDEESGLFSEGESVRSLSRGKDVKRG